MDGIKAIIFDWSGAHHVIDTLADLPQRREDMAGSLASGYTPRDDRENER